MLISEMIKQLEELKKKHGDREVFKVEFAPASFCSPLNEIIYWEKLYRTVSSLPNNMEKWLNGEEDIIKSDGIIIW